MMHAAVSLAALAVGFGFVSVSRALAWSTSPWLMAATASGGISTAWVFCIAAQNQVTIGDVVVLAMSAVTLLAVCRLQRTARRAKAERR